MRGSELEPRLHAVAIFALVLLGAAIYVNSLDVPFYFDDLPNIVESGPIQLGDLAPASLWRAAFEAREPRPVANLTLALNYWAGGTDVFGYHVVNVAIHALNGALVYLVVLVLLCLARSTDGGPADSRTLRLGALFAAALFVAHPAQIQSVTYVVQRMNSLAVTFYLLAWLGFVHGRLTADRRRRWLAWGAALLVWALALGTKQIAGTLPILVLLTEWFFFRDLDAGWARRNAGIFAIPIGLLVLLTALYVGVDPLERLSAAYGTRDFTLGERLLTQPRVVWFYASLLAFPLPSRFSLLHAFETSHSLFDPPTTALALLGLLVAFVFAIRVARTQRLLAFGILWFFLHLAIESSIFPLEMAFEHRIYLPMVGLALPLAAAWFSQSSGPTTVRVAGASLLVVLLAIATVVRNDVWREPVRFWADTVSKSPDRFRPRHNLAHALAAAGRDDEAIARYRETLDIDDSVAQVHQGLALVLRRAGREAEAAAHFERAFTLYAGVGRMLASRGALPAAVFNLQSALQLRVDDPELHNDLGVLVGRLGDPATSLRHFEAAVSLDPSFAVAQYNLGNAYAGRGDFARAIAHLEHAVALDPSLEEASETLVRVRAQAESTRPRS